MLKQIDSLTEELLFTRVNALIPQSVLNSVKNPKKLDIVSPAGSNQILNFIIVEHDCSGLTNFTAWQNRLHQKFRHHIEQGSLSITDRILLSCQLRIVGNEEAILLVSDYDGEKGKGFATDFYKNSLPKLAQKLGIKIIAGMNTVENMTYFTDKLGRYKCEQLKPEQEKRLFGNLTKNEKDHITIQIVDPSDVVTYIKKD